MSEPLPYALPDTQFRIITERLADGGVRIVVPAFTPKWGPISPLNLPALKPWRIGLARLLPPRLDATLDGRQFSIRQSGRESDMRYRRHTWPLADVGVIRPNQFDHGIYVVITGKVSINLLYECRDDVTHYVGGELEAALLRLRGAGVAS